MANAVVRTSSAIELSITEAEEMIDFNIEAWEDGEELSPIIMYGMPGIGKTDICRHAADRHDMIFRVCNLSNMAKDDAGGIPIPYGRDTDNPTVKYAMNDQLAFPDKGKKYMLLFDELTNVDEEMQKIAMRIFLEREINGNKIPDNVFIIAAGNRMTDRSKTYNLLSPMASRAAHVVLVSTLEEFRRWGRQTGGLDPKTSAFIAAFPNFFHAMIEEENDPNVKHDRGFYSGPWYCPRTIAAASKAVQRAEKKGLGLSVILREVSARCGAAYASTFGAFYNVAEKFDNVREVMIDPNKTVKIPDERDARYAFASAVVYNLWTATNDDEQEKLVQGFYRILGDPNMDAAYTSKILTEAQEGSAKVDHIKASDILVAKHLAEFQAVDKKSRRDQHAKV